MKLIKELLIKAYPSLFSVAAALIIGALVLVLSGFNPITSYQTLFLGAFGSPYALSETLVKMIPILIISLGTSVAFRSKLWNIGGNGQYTIGAIVSVIICVYTNLPPVLVLPLSLLGAIAAGLLYGALIGLMKAKLNANEVITTPDVRLHCRLLSQLLGVWSSHGSAGTWVSPVPSGFQITAFPQTDQWDTVARRAFRCPPHGFPAYLLLEVQTGIHTAPGGRKPKGGPGLRGAC